MQAAAGQVADGALDGVAALEVAGTRVERAGEGEDRLVVGVEREDVGEDYRLLTDVLGCSGWA